MVRRPRRNRKNKSIRGLAQETRLDVQNLVYPLFLVEGENIRSEVLSLPGNFRLSGDQAAKTIESCLELGLTNFILFPSIAEPLKDKEATHSIHPDNFYLQVAQDLKQKFSDIVLISDVAMDPYSSDGHDGLVENGKILNDATLPILAKMAVAQAQAGFDILGPSDMMDGRVGAIRSALDAAGYPEVNIMSYTAKYASAFYSPFRDALDSAPKAGDKKTYQMNPANVREAVIEGELDIEEGADFLMVKPAIHYLDVIKTLKDNFDIPIAAYHVSGECAMLIAACKNGWLEYDTAMPEALMSIKRAGADVIISYFAKDMAKMLKK